MSRGLLSLTLLLMAAAAPVAAVEPGLAGSPFPQSAQAPSPFARGVKSSSSPAPAPCLGPCRTSSGYGAPPPAVGYAPLASGFSGEPFSGDAPRAVRVGVGDAATQTMNLPRGKSAVVDLPTEARDVMVTDPKVADVVLSTPRRIYVTGVASGQTDATFVDGVGRRILHLDIRVDQDWTGASETLARMMPGTRLQVHAANNNLILTGEASSAGEADRALKLVGSFVARPEQVVNLVTITGGDQVMLQVKIVEVNRSVIKQLGFNLNAITGQLGMPQYSFLKAPTYGVNGSYLGGASGGYALNTTSQPTAGYPGATALSGLTQAAGLLSGAASAGIPIASIGQYISSFLTGAGSALSSSQSTYVQNYVNGALASTSVPYTPVVNGVATAPISLTAAQVGISTSNITAYEQALTNGASSITLTDPQRAFLTYFNTTSLPSYNAQALYSLQAGQTSTFVDRTNPANFVQTGRAGSAGLNQAEAMVQAFERVGLIRTLAEPTLTVVSGESGKFLVGGEFPVPVAQDVTGRVTIEYKPYGVGLGYTPVVLSDGRISLKLSTEVSELSNVGSFTLSAGSSTSLVVPGLNVRRVEDTIELPSGGSMMIAGLLSSQSKQTLDNLPGLGQIPIVGTLLRSRDFQSNETELVIMVTPFLVKPTRPGDLATPADGLRIAGDIETNLLGRLNTGFGKTAPAPAAQTYQGPFGHVID